MLARLVLGAVTAGAMVVPAFAGSMNADEARRFVAGKVFAFTCFDGTRGAGRILDDLGAGEHARQVRRLQAKGAHRRVVVGDDRRLPVRRILCVGQNYAAHAREMGSDPDKQTPFFFSKPADALVSDGTNPAYPSATQNLWKPRTATRVRAAEVAGEHEVAGEVVAGGLRERAVGDQRPERDALLRRDVRDEKHRAEHGEQVWVRGAGNAG